MPIAEPSRVSRPEDGDDSHLRSTQAVRDYGIQTSEETIGHVTDFIIDDDSWAIRHPVVETGHWAFGKEIVISPKHTNASVTRRPRCLLT